MELETTIEKGFFSLLAAVLLAWPLGLTPPQILGLGAALWLGWALVVYLYWRLI